MEDIFCNKKLTEGATVTHGDKGCEGIVNASFQSESRIVGKPDDIHWECREKFCHLNEIELFKQKRYSDSETVQYVSDNMHHDMHAWRFLDSPRMGIIAVVKSMRDVTSEVKRVSLTTGEISAVEHISNKKFISLGDGLANVKYEALSKEPKHREIPRKITCGKLSCLSGYQDQHSQDTCKWWTTETTQDSRRPYSLQMVNNRDHPLQSCTVRYVNSALHFVVGHAQFWLTFVVQGN